MKQLAYFVLETEANDAGEFQALIAKKGEKGYYPTDWFWGTDFEMAQQIANERNARMGLSEEEARRIILSTM